MIQPFSNDTKPVCLTYNGTAYAIGSWRELYCKAVTLVCEANDGKLIQRYLDKELPGCRYIMFPGQRGKRRMVSARRIAPGVYIESHGSATSLMKRLGDLLMFFNVSDGRPSVTYIITDPEMRRLKAEAEVVESRKSAVKSRKKEDTGASNAAGVADEENTSQEQAPIAKEDSFGVTADPWAETGSIIDACQEQEIPLYLTEGANHSLETGDVLKDVQILKETMSRIDTFMREG